LHWFVGVVAGVVADAGQHLTKVKKVEAAQLLWPHRSCPMPWVLKL